MRSAARCEQGGSLLLVLLIVTVLLGGAGVAIFVQLADARSVGVVRKAHEALFCAESGLAVARKLLGSPPYLDPGGASDWLPVRGSVGDGDAVDDFEVTVRPGPAAPEPTFFLESRCLKYPDAPTQVTELVGAGGRTLLWLETR